MKLKVKRLKKWLNKALLCGALACALALPAGFAVSAEEGELPPNAEPGAQITAAPTAEITAEPPPRRRRRQARNRQTIR